MRIIFHNWLSRFLILVMLLGVMPLSTGSILAQSSSKKEQRKKKPERKKTTQKKKPSKKPSKKKPKKKKRSKAKKRPSQKSKKKKRPKRKKRLRKKPVEKGSAKPTPKVESQPETVAITTEEKISAIEFANEMYTLTESLTTSSRQLARAARYLDSEDEHRAIRIGPQSPYSIRDSEAAITKEPDNIRLQRELGLHYEANHDWERAKELYLRLIAKNPSNPDFHYYLGSMYVSMGELDNARYSFEEALDLKPDHKGTLDAMASYMDSGDKKQMSKEVLMRSSQQYPDGPAQQMSLIRSKIQEGFNKDAIKLAKSVSEQYPDHSGFLFLTGTAYEQLGELNKAKVSYQKAVRMDPKNKEIHLALANLYHNQGKYVYAALSYANVVQLDPGYLNARYMQGLSYFNASEWGRAIAAWEDLLYYQPDNPLVRTLLPQAYYVLAIEYNRLGKPVLGRTAFNKALSVNKDTNDWLFGSMQILGKYYRDKRMFKESLAAYREVVELRPKDANAYLGLGITYWKMGEAQLARNAWERSLELNPDNNEAKGWLIVSQQGS